MTRDYRSTQEARERERELHRRMRIMLIGAGILFGGIFLYKGITGLLFKHFMASQSHVVTVSTMKVDYSEWDSRLQAVASLRAIRGVNVTTELAGMVRTISFVPGSITNAGTVLVELNTDPDVAQLRALQASAELADITYRRDKKQLAIKGVSKEVVDTDAANLKNLLAQVDQQAATIAKKIIRAPFTGRLGVSAVNPGQYISPGDTVVTLQQLSPIYVDFFVPQQQLVELKVGQAVVLDSDAVPGKKFTGKITTINPVVDTSTRNVEIEATLDNAQQELVPGMFGTVTVETGKPQRFLTLPQTAISYNPFGDIVYIVNKSPAKKKGKDKLTVMQIFVKTGETRGDQVAILDGLHAGDEIVTSGQLKLKNGSEIAINDSVVPSNNPAPSLPNEH